jgi:hypothetical protein
MMRFVLAVLLVLNLATLAWQWGALAHWGWAPDTAREPERMHNQLRPEALKVETPAAFKQRMAAEATTPDGGPASTLTTDPTGPTAPQDPATAQAPAASAPNAPAARAAKAPTTTP